MKTLVIFLLIISCSCLPLAIGCSCHPDYLTKPRSEVICFAYSNEASIYKIKIVASQCKCLLGQSQRFSCIDFRLNSSQNVVGRVRGLFECQGGGMPHLELFYSSCQSVINKAGGRSMSITNDTTNVENIACNSTNQYGIEKDGCEVSYHPCYYSGIIEAVYKGNLQVGVSVNVSGPDVTTTCGQYGRVLTVGESYIAGIGGPCFTIDPWSTYNSYTSDDIQLLEGLRDGGNTNCTKITSTTTPTPPTVSSGLSQEGSIIIGLSSFLGLLLVVIIIGFIITIIIIMKRKMSSQRRGRRITSGVVEIDVRDEEVKIHNDEDITSDDKAIIFNS
ncbi:PREDICTED: uncharacterized protein LOC100637196 isoform X2 [Amphimedon queenslandica]|uniref:SUEL-type lectin domain-containing protein n=1 Tax=Amphimedon queenslandica TaxID=400682 RepID=A0AAN0IU89_AMPQE|nr:PREDICTED: uncharacterized protein LOC100637196 isoform X2 [Amphimedon queenslandica]|eukprot:XP_011409850.1 PREDICTED: uncharacterized protein LOC100637196 isoform X2 [Amphimedon queenslandica]